MTAGEFCIREVTTAERGMSVTEAAKLMRDRHVGALVVVESSDRPEPVGLLTDRDLVVEVLGEEVPVDSITVGDVMSADLLTAREEDGLWDTLERMRTRGVRRVPVVDRGNFLVGILAADDVLELLAQELGALSRLIRREQEQEAGRRK